MAEKTTASDRRLPKLDPAAFRSRTQVYRAKTSGKSAVVSRVSNAAANRTAANHLAPRRGEKNVSEPAAARVKARGSVRSLVPANTNPGNKPYASAKVGCTPRVPSQRDSRNVAM